MIKIQINDLAALERLIGGDGQLEFDIRQSIVESFTKKHLRGLANGELVSKVATGLRNEIQKELIDNSKSSSYSVVLTPKAKEAFKEAIDIEVKKTINALVSEQIKKDKLLRIVAEAITNQADIISNEISEKIITGKLDEMVNLRLKTVLNLK